MSKHRIEILFFIFQNATFLGGEWSTLDSHGPIWIKKKERNTKEKEATNFGMGSLRVFERSNLVAFYSCGWAMEDGRNFLVRKSKKQ